MNANNIDSLKALVNFGLSVLKTGKDIFVGGFHAQNLGELMTVYAAATPLFSSFGDVLPELESLTDDEIAQLTAMVVAQGKTGEVVKEALTVANHVFGLVKAIKA